MVTLFIIAVGCTSQNVEKLPFLRYELVENDQGYYDTLHHSIQDFTFINQDSVVVTNSTFDNKIYIADFFFTSCPSICPIMKTQMLRVYNKFLDQREVAFLSYTIDPRHDSVPVLKEYAERLEVESAKWHFVTGEKEVIYELAQRSYMSIAGEDNQAAGGYIHSGRFILVDKERRIRGVYDGTSEDDVNKLMADIPVLLNEYK